MTSFIRTLLDFDQETSGYHKGTLLFIVLAYLFFLLPVLPQATTYHSDERFYTDAAVYMAQHAEYLTPRYADGSLRLNKPIATYWILMAGYAVGGMNYFGARLPFLLIGCLTLWLTFHLSLTLFGRRRGGVLAAAILAGNVQFITLSLRATPDILQTFFLNLSLLGFSLLLFQKERRLRTYLFAYMGAALGVATKGMLGIAPVAFAFIYASFTKERKDHIRRLINLPVMASAALLAAAWFAIMYWQHGHEELARFYQDQVGERLSGPKYLFLFNLKDYLWGFVRYFMPWCLVVLAGCLVCRSALSAFVRAHGRSIAFIAGWTVLLLAVFSGGNISRTRYLIPAYPLLACLCASLFMAVFEESRIQRLWSWICRLFLGVLLLAGSLLAFGGTLLNWRFASAGLLILGTASAVIWLTKGPGRVISPLMVGLLILFSTACTHVLVLPVLQAVPAQTVAGMVLADDQLPLPAPLRAERRFKFAGQLYLISKGRILPSHFPKGPLPGDLDQQPLVLLSQKSVETMSLEGYAVAPCGMVARSEKAKAGDLWKAWRAGGARAFFEILYEPCYLARRR